MVRKWFQWIKLFGKKNCRRKSFFVNGCFLVIFSLLQLWLLSRNNNNCHLPKIFRLEAVLKLGALIFDAFSFLAPF